MHNSVSAVPKIVGAVDDSAKVNAGRIFRGPRQSRKLYCAAACAGFALEKGMATAMRNRQRSFIMTS